MRKLKLPLWHDIIYLLFVGLAPIIVTCLELFSAHSTVFKWSFSSVGAILITVILLRRFILKGVIDKLVQKCVLLEHDYSINNGEQELIIKTWKYNNLIIYGYHAIVVLLSAILAWIFIMALAEGLIAFRGASTMILGFVLLGIIFKIICLATMKGGENNE